MTVKEAVHALRKAKTLCLVYDGDTIPFDKDSRISVAAFGDYIVDEICGTDTDDRYEIVIAAQPMKAGDVR